MTAKRFWLVSLEYDGEQRFVRDNNLIGEKSMSNQEVVDLLNELHEENQIKLEIVDAFMRGMRDEKGIAPKDKEFQFRMDHTIGVLKRLKEDMLNPTDFKRLKELEE